ncbi:MAG: N-acetylmuramoyl-L-alanine amidase, partial [Oscillospiraceae bacterium]
NFKVLFNGKEIELNEAGNFYYHEELDIGSNVFTIQNKGKTIKYTIIRMVTVLKGIEPTGDMAIEERSNIVISANAYRGSNVTAKLNGKTIKLNPTEEQLEGYENSAYIRYTGIYVAPKGIVNKAQNLGHVVVTGTYKGKDGTPFIMNLTGGNVTINPLPEVPNNADGSLIVVRNDNTQTFDYLTTNNVATPDKCRLPAGTVDYVVKKVTYSGQDWKTSYYLTNSGKRISCSDVNVQENEPLGANNIVAKEAYIDGGDTVIKISSSIKMPFSMSYGGVNFGASGEGNFKVQNFTATSVTFTFDYSTSASGELSFPSGSIFSSANWSDTVINGVNKYQLTLTLSQAGKFNGVRATYDGEGNLLLRFNGNKNSLSGAVVVLDPGHGIKNGKLDPGGVGHITDQAIGLALSKRVEEKLRAEGATVYRLPTESQEIDVYSRSVVASQYNPDIFISIHGNTAPGSPNATGVEAYYFTPFSQPLAKSLSSAVGNYYTNVAYGGGDHNRGDKYSYYIVTLDQSFASVLLEVGFVTNYKEAMILNNPQHQDGIANAIVTGCRNYMSR